MWKYIHNTPPSLGNFPRALHDTPVHRDYAEGHRRDNHDGTVHIARWVHQAPLDTTPEHGFASGDQRTEERGEFLDFN